MIALLISQGVAKSIFGNYDVRAPYRLIDEVEKHFSLIARKSKLSWQDLLVLKELIFDLITFVPDDDFTHFQRRAKRICPDPDDVPYFALALHFGCILWSNDKRLKEQDVVAVYSTHELLGEFPEK